MSQIERSVKRLDTPRPLKSSVSRLHYAQTEEIKSIDELITLTEKMASALTSGHTNTESMNILLANLRIFGPELEVFFKDTLDRAFVVFRNASQDERLSIIARMNLLELIELRAKSWQVSDGINTYYKHKATDVQPDNTGAVIDLTLGTSPPTSTSAVQLLGPGELIRTSGKFLKPTKIPGKNYSKDEVVIRNADSGKVMGIKGRRVHMIEELSETIISFQRVNPGAKERLVQITGPAEDKINYAKQLIEETIRRNASPIRLEAPQGGSCSSLASSASDETNPRANRNSLINSTAGNGGGTAVPVTAIHNNFTIAPNAVTGSPISTGGLNVKTLRTSGGSGTGGNLLLHSLSTNDASLGEYKYTVSLGQRNIKITGDCFELVRIAKLVLDDYFSSSDFLASVEAGASTDSSIASSVTSTSTSYPFSLNIPVSHQLNTSTPFTDSGIGLNIIASGGNTLSGGSGGSIAVNNKMLNNNNCTEVDDDVFIIENTDVNDSTISLSNTSSTVTTPTPNGLTRSRRSHFSRKDSTPESTPSSTNSSERIIHKYERLILYSKSPHSWALPKNWTQICDSFPSIIRNKDLDDEKNRFDADKYLSQVKARTFGKSDDSTDSPDRE